MKVVPEVFNSVLFICVGNICRSPTAEFLMRHAGVGSRLRVSSAGLGALVGQGMDPLALALLHEHGLDGNSHRARQVDADMLAGADLILAMERRHLNALIRQAPEVSGKAFLLGKWQDEREIPDPYRQSYAAFQQSYGLIDEGVRSWCRYL